MIQSLFVLSPTGEVLIERHFRSTVTSRTVCDIFWSRASEGLNHHGGVSTAVSARGGGADALFGGGFGGGGNLIGGDVLGGNPFMLYDSVPPIMEVPDVNEEGADAGSGGSLYLFSVLRDGLSYLAACPACIGINSNGPETPPLLVIEFLHRIADTFVLYFGNPADESAVKDNFGTAYQLLEEMVDYGWPLTTEPNALTDLIRPPTVMAKVRYGKVCLVAVLDLACPTLTIPHRFNKPSPGAPPQSSLKPFPPVQSPTCHGVKPGSLTPTTKYTLTSLKRLMPFSIATGQSSHRM